MNKLHFSRRTLAVLAVLLPLAALFFYVAVRSGPLAPIPVTLATVEEKPLSPALFGIGTVEARYTYRIGPTQAGRLGRLDVHVGEMVDAGQVLGEMDPVDLDERIRAQDAALQRAAALLDEARAQQGHARAEARRYEELLKTRATSEESVAARRRDLQIAEAGFAAAAGEVDRVRAEREALTAQRDNLRLIAPVAGLVATRAAEPGTTLVAGQTVVELIDPQSIWINVRFDQVSARGLAPNLPARIVLRSRSDQEAAGRVERVEPLADAVTEEILAKVVFDRLPEPLPPLGELAEVTLALPPLPAGPIIPNAAIQRVEGRTGVWQVEDGEPRFVPVGLGIGDLDGQVLVEDGLGAGDQVVVYSKKALARHSRIQVFDRLSGVAP
ncbi:MAG: efflux RND transporter periplasmic adaptor subunit [Desulfobulbaceae bacterium]|jgi:RND family efflux transporter MFP subunit